MASVPHDQARMIIRIDKSEHGSIVIGQGDDIIAIPKESVEDFLDGYLEEKRKK